MHFLVCQQCDQIGPFSKILGDKSSFNSGPYIWRIFGLFLKLHFLSKNCSDCFLGNCSCKFRNFLVKHLVALLMPAMTCAPP